MNPARLTAFMLAYVDGLTQAVIHNRHRYRLQADDTPETYALRVACTVTNLFQTKGPGVVDLDGLGFRNACNALKIEHSEKSIHNYLEVSCK